MGSQLEFAMTQQALVEEELRLRGSDGAEVIIPHGPLEIEFADGAAKLRWHDVNGKACHTAMHPDEYERYVIAGLIRPSLN
jgi:hypothetical protein